MEQNDAVRFLERQLNGNWWLYLISLFIHRKSELVFGRDLFIIRKLAD